MKTRLVWITPDAEAQVMYCARVSNPKNQNSGNFKLIEHLIKEGHWSPLEMANACFEIETSRRISPQILRHRSFSFQEFSQRYAAVQEFEPVHPRRQDKINRQNSIDDLDETVLREFDKDLDEIQKISMRAYESALANGVSKESAAFLLPGTSQTRIYMNGTLRSWVHYINLRTGNGTQKEHMDIANSIKAQLSEHIPNIAKAVGWIEKE
jgi:thymidylate synthase (FAD)